MNSENQNLYSISDLADQVGVPRTTITDWLGKYSRFIELQTQGRRRFYTDRTLSVLCKIAELRTAGRSIGDIDGELERIFPVHPTVEPPDAAGGTEQNPAENGAGPDTANPNASQPNYPVVKQENFDELYELFGSKFSDLCDAMSAVNRKTDASARRLRLMLAVAVMIIVVLAGFLALFYVNFLVQRDNTAASRDAASAIAALTAGSETRENALRTDVGNLSGSVSGLAGSVSGMEGRVSGMTDELQKLRADLPAQRAAFDAAIEEMKRANGSAIEAQQAQFEARIALEKEQFAAERLKLLQQIDSLQERLNQAAESEPARDEEISKLREELAAQIERGKDVEKLREELAAQTERGREVDKLNEELNVVSGKIAELREKNQALSNELAAANRRAADETEARKKAEADAEKARRAANSSPVQNNSFPQSGGYPYQGM
ncbi:MAG: MerR family transcriptional regulator [Lentisphaeria bacterium]|nr:MerR family transcriptional regulator [Lentisphaeria bacterium]